MPLAALMLVLAAPLFAQAPPAFEVASVKPAAPRPAVEGARRENIEPGPASLSMRNVRFSAALKWAYSLQDYQITGPGWINDDRYDIVARTETPVAENQLRNMLQTLLKERFQLQFHRQTKEMQALALVVSKGGHKMKESQGEGPARLRPNGRMGAMADHASIPEMAAMLSQPLRMPVIDQTGLTGRYDFTVDMTPYINEEMMKRQPGAAPPDILGIVMAALQEQLGLRLEAHKMPVEMFIIDHAEKTPAEN